MRWGVGVVVLAALAVPGHAQVTSDAFGIERFRLSIDGRGLLDVDSADVPEHRSWSAGVFAGFAHDPLVVYDANKEPIERLVDGRLTTGLVGSVALFNRVQIGGGVDLVGYQSGSDAMGSLPSAGLGDARLVAKVLLARTEMLQLAIVPTLTVPAGSAKGYLREDGITFAPALAVSGARDRFRAALNVGYRLKPRVEVAGLVSDDEAFGRAGVGARFGKAEAWVSVSIAMPVKDVSSNKTAIESMFGGAYGVSERVGVFAGAGIGLDNGFGVPDWRALAGMRFDYETATKPPAIVTVEPPPPVVEKPVVAPPPPVEPKVVVAKLNGRVVDKDGRPIPRATILFGDRELVADDTGAFAIEYAGGAVKISAQAPQYQGNTVDANVAPGAAGTIDIVLARAARQGQLRGQVLSFAGKPLAATVTIKGATTLTTKTDADGQYTIDLPDGAFEVTIESPGHTTQTRSVKIKIDNVTVLNVDLRGAK